MWSYSRLFSPTFSSYLKEREINDCWVEIEIAAITSFCNWFLHIPSHYLHSNGIGCFRKSIYLAFEFFLKYFWSPPVWFINLHGPSLMALSFWHVTFFHPWIKWQSTSLTTVAFLVVYRSQLTSIFSVLSWIRLANFLLRLLTLFVEGVASGAILITPVAFMRMKKSRKWGTEC